MRERERERERSSVKSIPSKPKPINQSSFLTLIITAALSVYYQAILLRLPFPTTRFSRNSHVTRLIKASGIRPLCPPLKKPPLGVKTRSVRGHVNNNRLTLIPFLVLKMILLSQRRQDVTTRYQAAFFYTGRSRSKGHTRDNERERRTKLRVQAPLHHGSHLLFHEVQRGAFSRCGSERRRYA